MKVFSCRKNIRMSDNNKPSEVQTGKSILRPLRRSKTINVSQFANGGEKGNGEVSFLDNGPEHHGQVSPQPQPTSSCQALRHAVSALTRIDDFILEELGDGFFANVYKATHRVTGEVMVMKINKDSANRHSALREVQLMNKLSHPNILRFLGVCVHEGQLHALTEYISGGTLESLLMSLEEELPWTLRLKLSLDIAKGMNYLHVEGVFHRDLTSKNVLIKKGENKNYQAIIADLGLATKIPDPNAIEPLPSVGCPWWMAPEVINGKFYDERADLFAYGIINLEMTARIEADPETMPRTQSFGVDYVRFCEMVDYCPLDFLQLVFKCCQILPERRPKTVVIISTLDKIYKNMRMNALASSGKLHKRSRSEDNIIQSSDSFSSAMGCDEVFMTPQIIAQAMSEDDPHYSPANANPFASISRFKDGRKVLEFPRSRKCSSNGSVKNGDPLSTSFSLGSTRGISEGQASQSLPSSPIMLRRAAEKMHQASLHGKDAIKTESRHDLQLSFSSDNQGVNDDSVTDSSDRRARFGCNRTRSLGALDFWNPLAAPGACRRRGVSKRDENHPMSTCQSEKVGYCNRETAGIRESSFEDSLMPDTFSSYECMNVESLASEQQTNCIQTVEMSAHNSFHGFSDEQAGDSDHLSGNNIGSRNIPDCTGNGNRNCQAEISSSVCSDKPSPEPCLTRTPLAEKKVLLNNDENKPLISWENRSYSSDHFGKNVTSQVRSVDITCEDDC